MSPGELKLKRVVIVKEKYSETEVSLAIEAPVHLLQTANLTQSILELQTTHFSTRMIRLNSFAAVVKTIGITQKDYVPSSLADYYF